MALAVGAVPYAFAEEIAPAGEYKDGVAVGGWMLYPGVFVGGEYDSNINQSAADRDSGGSLRVVPRVTGAYNGGIHKATVYGIVDARFVDADTIAATAGFSYNYEAMRDLTFNVYGNYTRQTDIFNSAVNFNNGAIGAPNTPNTIPLIVNPFGTTPIANPIAYNQFTGGASVTKAFDRFFVTLGATASYIAYDHSDNVPNPFQTSHNGTSLWVTGRVGYHVVPTVYVFAEADGIWQRFTNSIFDTNGYRVIGGIGTDDRSSLFRGEIYGGYWAQNLDNQDVLPSGIAGNTNTPVFGGRLSYYPTRYWTFIASVDQTLGLSTFLTPTIPQGTSSVVTTALLQTTYGISRAWSVGARFGYTRADWIGIDRLDNGWLAGSSFNYEIWRNLSLTLDYQYQTLKSNLAFENFTRNIYTAGVTYKY